MKVGVGCVNSLCVIHVWLYPVPCNTDYVYNSLDQHLKDACGLCLVTTSGGQ